MADQTIVVDADTTGYVRKTRAASNEAKKGAQGLAGELSKVGQSFARSLITAGAIRQALVGAAQAATDLARNAGKISQDAGGSRLNRGRTLARLGLGSDFNQTVENAQGGTSIEERDAFLRSLQQAGVKGPRAAQAFNLYAGGLFDADEVLEAAKQRRLGKLADQSGKRAAALGEQGLTELGVRNVERDARARELATAGDTGAAARIAQARLAALRAENPGSFAVRDFVAGATEAVGGRQLIEAGEMAGMMAQQVDVLKDIRAGVTRGAVNLPQDADR